MKLNTRYFTVVVVAVLLVGSCSGVEYNPVEPVTLSDGTAAGMEATSNTQPWAFFDVSIDTEAGEAEINLNRSAMFTVNIVKMLNSSPPNLSININSIEPGTEYVDVDFDVSITHPVPGAPEFNAYDVRGVFVGDMGGHLFTDFCLAQYPHLPPVPQYLEKPGYLGSQEMMDDPVNADGGGPDGYTRWFSPKWFNAEGLFGYTQGVYASEIYSEPDYYDSADLNPYKFFADGLGVHEDLVEWIDGNTHADRVFSSGATNTRNYFVRFSKTAIQFGYVVLANWEAVDVHPSNMREAVACEKIYATEHTDYFVFEFKLYDPISEVDTDTGMMEDYVLHLMVSSDHGTGGTILMYDNQKIPKEVGDGYCVWHHEISTDIMQIYGAYDFWVVARYPEYDYLNPYGVPNDLDTEELAGYFCFELDHSDEPWE